MDLLYTAVGNLSRDGEKRGRERGVPACLDPLSDWEMGDLYNWIDDDGRKAGAPRFKRHSRECVCVCVCLPPRKVQRGGRIVVVQ